MITIPGYLTQAKLAQVLQQLVPDGWLGIEVAVTGSRHRWDMAYQCGESITVVEYDGDEHYRHSPKIKIDRAKDEAARTQGSGVVRFPYWVQLDSTTLRHYFGLEAEIEQTFPHGFITTELFPASFCELGISASGPSCLPCLRSSAMRSSRRYGSGWRSMAWNSFCQVPSRASSPDSTRPRLGTAVGNNEPCSADGHLTRLAVSSPSPMSPIVTLNFKSSPTALPL